MSVSHVPYIPKPFKIPPNLPSSVFSGRVKIICGAHIFTVLGFERVTQELMGNKRWRRIQAASVAAMVEALKQEAEANELRDTKPSIKTEAPDDEPLDSQSTETIGNPERTHPMLSLALLAPALDSAPPLEPMDFLNQPNDCIFCISRQDNQQVVYITNVCSCSFSGKASFPQICSLISLFGWHTSALQRIAFHILCAYPSMFNTCFCRFSCVLTFATR